MNVMQLVVQDGEGTLESGVKPLPEPVEGEILVRVRAAGVTPAELEWYPTLQTKDGSARIEAVPAHEFSGTVERVGKGVSSVQPGEAISGMNDWFTDGAAAEYCITRPEWVAPLPQTLNFLQAAAVPIAALTAYQGVLVRGALQAGEQVLIHGGGGAVGLYAIQFARLHGARVVVTASAKDKEALIELGVERVIDYRNERFDEIVQKIDLVFDTVGGESLERSWNVLSAKGRVVTIASSSETTSDQRIKDAFFIVEPDRGQLMEVSRLIDGGSLQVFVKAVITLEGAAAAYDGSIQSESLGKVVLAVATG